MPIFRLQTSDFRLQTSIFRRFFPRSRSKKYLLSGFTLIELLIVVSIIGILSTVVLANYNSFGTRQSVKNAAAQLKSEIRKYQNFAISGQKTPDPSNTDCQDFGTLSHYIIFMTKPQFRAILLCSPAPFFDIVQDFSYPWSGQTVVEDFGYTGSTSGNCNWILAWFKPVNKGVDLWCNFSPVPAGADRVFVQLKNLDGSARYRVYVTSSGEIYDERQ